MPSAILFACLVLLTFVSPAAAQAPKTVFQGKKAGEEIGVFMRTRWHRQTWRIEFRPVAGLSSSSMWHIAGTPYWVRLDGPDDLKDHCDMAKMDTKSVYEITGVPVDQNYGTITFYILSPPEKVAGKAPNEASQDHPGEAANSSPLQAVVKLSEKDALCLAEACRITALMNDDKWDEVEKAFGTKEEMVAVLKYHATLKDWPGIGAYRGVRVDRESPREVTFRFGFAPKSSPHEIQIRFTEGNPSKPGLMVLGW